MSKKYPQKKCAICGKPFMPKSHNAMYCDDPKCKAEGKRQTRKRAMTKYYKSEGYKNRKLKSDEQPDRYCQFCGVKISRKTKNWWQKTVCDKPECKKKRQDMHNAKRRGAYSPETFKSFNVRRKPNGRRCRECGKKLYGNYRLLCPDCYQAKCNSVCRVDDDWIFNGAETDSTKIDMGITDT
jgi:hypothetical protein